MANKRLQARALGNMSFRQSSLRTLTMSHQPANYDCPERAAIFVSAEGGDVLTPVNLNAIPWISQRFGSHPPLTLYQQIKQIMAPYLKEGDRILDVGSATGRLIYELAKSDMEFESITGCEISALLSAYSSAILLGRPQHKTFPCVGESSWKPENRGISDENLCRIQADCSKSNIAIINDSVDSFAANGGVFDTVFCLNVVDRHTSPKALVESLANLLKRGGTLCVACAFDWARSPAKFDEFRDELSDFFGQERWTTLENQDVDYVIVGNARQVYFLRAQTAVYRFD
jgi:SAM-dependent methyltransferase